MTPRRVKSNKLVKADEGRVALQRGPIIYCIEAIDQQPLGVIKVVLDKDVQVHYDYQSLMLNGIGILTWTIEAGKKELEPGKVSFVPQEFIAIPYYAWANRGPGEMTVWLYESDSTRFH
jgi:DUF1680 family protein